ncbi:MAG: UDP-N-acetylmuramate--alanine ligase [Actinomycetota bacterium]|nr:UDP-N-acetylmuramate--alanine ligase [Actinomycetota bacterium]
MTEPTAGTGSTAGALDLREPRRIHLVGVAGAGMSPIAEVLAAMGHTVSGSDLHPSAVLDRLGTLGVAVHVGHDPLLVAGVDVVVISTAVPATNIEVAAAGEASIPVVHRSEMLAAICRLRRTAAIAGTHGKTTTSALLAVALDGAGLRPSFVVGGVILDFGTGARWDTGDWMVAEADESDGSFLRLPADLAVVTSVEPDHLDHWGSFDAVTAAFDTFLAAAGARLVSADDAVAAELGHRHGATTYGTATTADFRMVDVVGGRSSVRFALLDHGTVLGDVDVPRPGLHNARNAAGALAAAVLVGADFAPAAEAVGSWGGVGRRFQTRGEREGVTYVDDYAHLPGEVAAVLAAARDGDWQRVVCVFQPHRYSRTQSLWRDFGTAFRDADVLVVTDVYPAGEQPRPGVSGLLVADAVAEADPARPVAYVAGRGDLVAHLRRLLRPGDLCLTLGAGDVTTLADELLTE